MKRYFQLELDVIALCFRRVAFTRLIGLSEPEVYVCLLGGPRGVHCATALRGDFVVDLVGKYIARTQSEDARAEG